MRRLSRDPRPQGWISWAAPAFRAAFQTAAPGRALADHDAQLRAVGLQQDASGGADAQGVNLLMQPEEPDAADDAASLVEDGVELVCLHGFALHLLLEQLAEAAVIQAQGLGTTHGQQVAVQGPGVERL